MEHRRIQLTRLVIPQHIHQRIVMHSAATVTGAAFAVRMGAGRPWWEAVMWYFGSFVGFHVAAIPFVATFIMMQDRMDRWVRGVVQEELIRFDLASYDRQLRRILPGEHTGSAEPEIEGDSAGRD